MFIAYSYIYIYINQIFKNQTKLSEQSTMDKSSNCNPKTSPQLSLQNIQYLKHIYIYIYS